MIQKAGDGKEKRLNVYYVCAWRAYADGNAGVMDWGISLIRWFDVWQVRTQGARYCATVTP